MLSCRSRCAAVYRWPPGRPATFTFTRSGSAAKPTSITTSHSSMFSEVRPGMLAIARSPSSVTFVYLDIEFCERGMGAQRQHPHVVMVVNQAILSE